MLRQAELDLDFLVTLIHKSLYNNLSLKEQSTIRVMHVLSRMAKYCEQLATLVSRSNSVVEEIGRNLELISNYYTQYRKFYNIVWDSAWTSTSRPFLRKWRWSISVIGHILIKEKHVRKG